MGRLWLLRGIFGYSGVSLDCSGVSLSFKISVSPVQVLVTLG